jgi:hypothetical protein
MSPHQMCGYLYCNETVGIASSLSCASKVHLKCYTLGLITCSTRLSSDTLGVITCSTRLSSDTLHFAHSVFMFRMILRIESDYFSNQHKLVGLDNGDAVLFSVMYELTI